VTPTRMDLFAVARLLADQPLNGELQSVTTSFRPLVDHLGRLGHEARGPALDAFLCPPGMDREVFLRALADVDVTAAAPEPERLRAAHAGDLASNTLANRFVWGNRIVRAHFNLLSSDPKIGKTHLVLDWARRIYLGLPWPDGADPTFPAGSKVLWVCGDRHQDELRERARAFGLPDEAVLLNALPTNPYGGWDLDEPENVELLRKLIEVERPALVSIDTVWRATRRQLRREEEINALLDPILTIAQETDTAIIGLMHLSKDGETLGRRIEGLARAVMKLTRPDPEGQPDRRKLTTMGNFKEPPPLGVTMGPTGCEYDSTPPAEAAPNKGGRSDHEREGFKKLILEALDKQDHVVGNELLKSLKDPEKVRNTFWRAAEALEEDGRIIIEGGAGTGKQKTFHRICPTSQDPPLGAF